GFVLPQYMLLPFGVGEDESDGHRHFVLPLPSSMPRFTTRSSVPTFSSTTSRRILPLPFVSLWQTPSLNPFRRVPHTGCSTGALAAASSRTSAMTFSISAFNARSFGWPLTELSGKLPTRDPCPDPTERRISPSSSAAILACDGPASSHTFWSRRNLASR